MDRIQAAFQQRRKLFIAYITAGFPSVADTVATMKLLVECGVDIIELGYPFSDPTADGPAIQFASQKALDSGFKRDDYFCALTEFRATDTTTPVVVFGYYNPIFHCGSRAFVARVRESGGDAVLIVDIPFEEQGEIRPLADEYGLHLIQLIAPTTDVGRKRRILAAATGFIYQISVRGVTGERRDGMTDVKQMIQDTRQFTKVPIAVGFGISTVDQVNSVGGVADGIVIGSAIVNTIARNPGGFHEPLRQKVRELAVAIHAL